VGLYLVETAVIETIKHTSKQSSVQDYQKQTNPIKPQKTTPYYEAVQLSNNTQNTQKTRRVFVKVFVKYSTLKAPQKR
jgi:hypothetical protein